MSLIGNILWLLLGGIPAGFVWFVAGLLCCITVVGIPLGRQCFKFASLALCPFGKEVVYGGGAGSLIANILWILLLGWEMAIAFMGAGIALCVTIIGIPFGLQYFKLAKLALMPFGARVR